MIDLFIILLKPALRAADQGSKNPLDWLALLIAFPLDVLIAHTTWALAFGWPRKGEWTISHTLERLCVDWDNPDMHFHRRIAIKINTLSPNHIKAVA